LSIPRKYRKSHSITVVLLQNAVIGRSRFWHKISSLDWRQDFRGTPNWQNQ